MVETTGIEPVTPCMSRNNKTLINQHFLNICVQFASSWSFFDHFDTVCQLHQIHMCVVVHGCFVFFVSYQIL